MFTIANISYLGDWFSRVWDKGCCVRVEIVYVVNGMKLVATSEDRKGTMVLDDGSKHVGVGIWLDVIDWLLKGPVVANAVTINKPIKIPFVGSREYENVGRDEEMKIICSPLTLKPMSVESAIADLNEMKARIQFAGEVTGITVAEEDVVDQLPSLY